MISREYSSEDVRLSGVGTPLRDPGFSLSFSTRHEPTSTFGDNEIAWKRTTDPPSRRSVRLGKKTGKPQTRGDGRMKMRPTEGSANAEATPAQAQQEDGFDDAPVRGTAASSLDTADHCMLFCRSRAFMDKSDIPVDMICWPIRDSQGVTKCLVVTFAAAARSHSQGTVGKAAAVSQPPSLQAKELFIEQMKSIQRLCTVRALHSIAMTEARECEAFKEEEAELSKDSVSVVTGDEDDDTRA